MPYNTSVSDLATKQIDWDAIVNQFGDDEEAVLKSRAAVMLACGESRTQVSKELSVAETQIKAWMDEDPNFRSAFTVIKGNVVSYLEQQLPNKIFKADKVIDWVLDTDLESVSPKLQVQLLKEKGLTARRLYEAILSKQVKDKASVTVSIAALNISESAARVLLDRVPEIIDVTPEEKPSA